MQGGDVLQTKSAAINWTPFFPSISLAPSAVCDAQYPDTRTPAAAGATGPQTGSSARPQCLVWLLLVLSMQLLAGVRVASAQCEGAISAIEYDALYRYSYY